MQAPFITVHSSTHNAMWNEKYFNYDHTHSPIWIDSMGTKLLSSTASGSTGVDNRPRPANGSEVDWRGVACTGCVGALSCGGVGCVGGILCCGGVACEVKDGGNDVRPVGNPPGGGFNRGTMGVVWGAGAKVGGAKDPSSEGCDENKELPGENRRIVHVKSDNVH